MEIVLEYAGIVGLVSRRGESRSRLGSGKWALSVELKAGNRSVLRYTLIKSEECLTA